MTAYGSRLVIAVVGVGIGFLVLVGILYLIRRRSGPSPFLRGGKNRQPRLQVLDAAAVDARRRIVLIRRDNVEHLVMIGGPTDIVIESGIGAARDGETLDRAPAETPQISAPAAEPRLEAPAQQPRIAATKPDAPETNVAAVFEPPRPAVRAAPAQGNTMVRPATTSTLSKPAEPAAPLPTAQTVPTSARAEVLEPVILAEAPALRSVAEPAKQSSTPSANPAPDVGAASDALDAARRRVFQPQLDRTPTAGAKAESGDSMTNVERTMPRQPAAVPEGKAATAEPDVAPEKPRSLGSDFDRILEEEMASKLSAQKPDSSRETFTPALPRRDPANPKVTGATPEPTLQNEIARIFGEMSVTRDDR